MIICISIREWVYETYIKGFSGKNRSKYIEENFVRGVETEIGNDVATKTQTFELVKENRLLKEEIKQLKAERAKHKKKEEKWTHPFVRKDKIEFEYENK